MSLRRLAAAVVALCLVLPLLGPEVWSGFRLAQSDPVLSVIAPTEQPLSIRSPDGAWAVTLALVWFGLAYRHRRVTLWETALVLIGGAAVLARLGNAWVDAAAMLAPLARQVSIAPVKPPLLALLATASVCVGVVVLVLNRPPALPVPAAQAVTSSTRRGTVLADWRWAGDVRHLTGTTGRVLPAGGLASPAPDFWLDYLRIAQGHEHWAEALARLNVDVVVLDASDQQRAAAALVRSSSDWQVLFDADGALIAERIGS